MEERSSYLCKHRSNNDNIYVSEEDPKEHKNPPDIESAGIFLQYLDTITTGFYDQTNGI